MPLTRGDTIGYDADRLSYMFTMMNGVHTVHCEISSVALGDLGRWERAYTQDREAQFLLLRDMIEKIASDLFDNSNGQTRAVRIFAKHLPRR
jgi:hypothetical protein